MPAAIFVTFIELQATSNVFSPVDTANKVIKADPKFLKLKRSSSKLSLAANSCTPRIAKIAKNMSHTSKNTHMFCVAEIAEFAIFENSALFRTILSVLKIRNTRNTLRKDKSTGVPPSSSPPEFDIP